MGPILLSGRVLISTISTYSGRGMTILCGQVLVTALHACPYCEISLDKDYNSTICTISYKFPIQVFFFITFSTLNFLYETKLKLRPQKVNTSCSSLYRLGPDEYIQKRRVWGNVVCTIIYTSLLKVRRKQEQVKD